MMRKGNDRSNVRQEYLSSVKPRRGCTDGFHGTVQTPSIMAMINEMLWQHQRSVTKTLVREVPYFLLKIDQ